VKKRKWLVISEMALYYKQLDGFVRPRMERLLSGKSSGDACWAFRETSYGRNEHSEVWEVVVLFVRKWRLALYTTDGCLN
jgi:hypothetical protein